MMHAEPLTTGTRSPPRGYLHIRNLLEQESRIHRFLYIVPEPKLASFILDCFSGTNVAMFVGLAADFVRSFSEMTVTEATSRLSTAIIAALRLSDSFTTPFSRLS